MEIVCSMKAQRLWKKASPTPFPVPFLIIPRIVEEICANSILCSGLRRFGRLSCSFPDPFLSGAGNSPILGKIRECRPASNKIPVFFPCSQERPPVIAVTTSWDGGFEIKVRPSSCRTFVVSPQDSVLLRTCDSHLPSCCKRAGRRRQALRCITLVTANLSACYSPEDLRFALPGAAFARETSAHRWRRRTCRRRAPS